MQRNCKKFRRFVSAYSATFDIGLRHKAVVEAIFQAQEKINLKNVWRERWIGFAFGVAASLLASFVWFVIRLWGNEKRKT